jgi:hypothetical protein
MCSIPRLFFCKDGTSIFDDSLHSVVLMERERVNQIASDLQKLCSLELRGCS